jgi:hypothetical protein
MQLLESLRGAPWLYTSVSIGRKVTLGVAKQANTSWSVEKGVSVGLTTL